MANIDKLYDKPKKSRSNPGDDDGLLRKARERARQGATYWKDNWEAAEDDLKFLGGEQWPQQIRTERELEQRPCLVNNVLPTFVDQVLGDQRQNRPTIKVAPVQTVFTKNEVGEDTEFKISNITGTKDYALAEVMSGIIKNIEYQCEADVSYDIAFQSAVESGLGYLRVRTDYINDESFEHDVIIDHIEDQFSVIIDPNSRENDRHDMNWCFIDETMNKDEFEATYPGVTPEPISTTEETDLSNWYADNTVRVSEYFTREPCEKTIVLLSDGRSVCLEEIKPVVDELDEQGVTIIRERKVKSYKVMWRKITGLHVLEGPVELMCSTIPVIPVYGKTLNIKRKKIYRSVIRHSKDAQRMANYWDSAATESVALAPKAPFIGTDEQFEGYEDEWETANTKNHSRLRYNETGSGPPVRSQPAAIPSAEITLGMGATDKIKATLGMFDASIGARGNETSGRAIMARQREADVGTFAFIDNLSRAIRRVGKIAVEMLLKTADTERQMRLKLPDDKEDFVVINQQVKDEESGEWITINDLNITKYDTIVTTGPSYTTQRMEAAEAMIQFAQAVPQAAAVIMDLMAQNMDWPGADVIAERLKKIVPPNVLTNQEREELQEDMPEQTEPTPEQKVEMAGYEADMAESSAKIAKAEADRYKAELESAEAQRQLAIIEQGANEGKIAYQQVKELVAEAIAEMIANKPTNQPPNMTTP